MTKRQKIIFIAIGAAALLIAAANVARGARADDVWQERLGTYLETQWSEGRDILINGTDKYLNFGFDHGSDGYGIRDNSGAMEFKDSGGAWAGLGSGGGSGGGGVGQFTTTLVVSTSTATGDCTDINLCLHRLPSTGGRLIVLEGTYTATSTILIPKSRVVIQGQGNSTIISCDSASFSPCIDIAGTGLFQIQVRDLAIDSTGSGTDGVGFDFSDAANTYWSNLRVSDFATTTVAADTANTTFYNTLRDIQSFNSKSCIDIAGTLANDNLVDQFRCRPLSGGSGIGVLMSNARGWNFNNLNVEPASAGTITGVKLTNITREIVFNNVWLENNNIGFQADSTTVRVNFIGGTITGSATSDCLVNGVSDCVQAGLSISYLNLNRNGTTRNSLSTLTGGLFASSTAQVTGTTTLYNSLQLGSTALGDNLFKVTGESGRIYGNSVSTGGLVNITNTNSDGAGLVLYNNDATPTGRLFVVNCDNVGFDQSCQHIAYDGTGDALSISSTDQSSNALSVTHSGKDHALSIGYTGSRANKGAASFTSTASSSAVNISGNELGQGTLKISHTGTGTDGNAAALSLDLAGSGTAAQGIFLDATGGGTIGKLLNLRNNSTEYLNLTSTGALNLINGAVFNASSSAHITGNLTLTGTTTLLNVGTVPVLGLNMTPTGDNLLSMTAGQTWSSSTSVGGAINLNNTSNDRAGIVVYSNNGATVNEALLRLERANSAFDSGALRINSAGTSGGDYEIRMDSPNPDIEFIETDQSTPAGKYEIDINNDLFRINGRNAADNSFDTFATFQREDVGVAGAAGRFCLGCGFSTPTGGRIEVVGTSTPGIAYLTAGTSVGGAQVLTLNKNGGLNIGNASTTSGGLYNKLGGLTVARAITTGRFTATSSVFMTGLTSAGGGTNNDVCIDAGGRLINETTGTCVVSSRRFKNNIKNLSLSGLDTILKLRPVSFSYNDDDPSDFQDIQFGLIAEEVAEVNPHLAKYGLDGLPRTLDDRALIASLIKAVQEQQREIETLKKEVGNLKRK